VSEKATRQSVEAGSSPVETPLNACKGLSTSGAAELTVEVATPQIRTLELRPTT
jgi:hypothetical protein